MSHLTATSSNNVNLCFPLLTTGWANEIESYIVKSLKTSIKQFECKYAVTGQINNLLGKKSLQSRLDDK